MLYSLRHKCLAALSAFVLLFQLFAPTLAMASGASPSLICNPSGQMSPEMRAGLDELKEALEIEDTDDAVMDCEDCVASVSVIFTPSSKAILSVRWVHRFVTPRSHEFILATPRGPPLGSRAPPYSL